MSRTRALVAATLSCCLLLTSCSNDEEQPAETAPQTTSAKPSSTRTPKPKPTGPPQYTVNPTPTPVAGATEEAVRNTLGAFFPMWAAYSPADFGDHKRAYFDSWKDMATDSFGLRQYRNFDRNWSWTWTEEKEVNFVEVKKIHHVTIKNQGAAARVHLVRYVMPIFGSQQDLVRENKIYDVQLLVGDKAKPKVHDVRPALPIDPPPVPELVNG